jgi:hypothetical protein
VGKLLLGARNLFLRLVGLEGGRAADGGDHGSGTMAVPLCGLVGGPGGGKKGLGRGSWGRDASGGI